MTTFRCAAPNGIAERLRTVTACDAIVPAWWSSWLVVRPVCGSIPGSSPGRRGTPAASATAGDCRDGTPNRGAGREPPEQDRGDREDNDGGGGLVGEHAGHAQRDSYGMEHSRASPGDHGGAHGGDQAERGQAHRQARLADREPQPGGVGVREQQQPAARSPRPASGSAAVRAATRTGSSTPARAGRGPPRRGRGRPRPRTTGSDPRYRAASGREWSPMNS